MADKPDDLERFAETYAAKYDDELKELAADRDNLTDAARAALEGELSRRGIAAPAIETSAGAEVSDSHRPEIIETFRDLPPALIAKGFLESAGISSFLLDQNLIRMDWMFSNAIGGIKLAVMREDVAAAKQALALGWEMPIEFPDGTTAPQPRCPQCDSPDVSYRSLNWPAAVATLIVNVPIPVKRRAWHCNSCGASWEMTEGGAPLE